MSGTLVTIAGFPAGRLRALDGLAKYAGKIFWVVGSPSSSPGSRGGFTPYLGVKMLPAIKPIEGGTTRSTGTPTYRACEG